METKRLKSHTPSVYDNTEEDLILAPPSVLENKLRDFEDSNRLHVLLGSNIALAVTILTAIVTAEFKDLLGLSGQTIRAVFVTAFIIMIVKIIDDLLKIRAAPYKSRKDVIHNLLGERVIKQDDKVIYADEKTKQGKRNNR